MMWLDDESEERSLRLNNVVNENLDLNFFSQFLLEFESASLQLHVCSECTVLRLDSIARCHSFGILILMRGPSYLRSQQKCT